MHPRILSVILLCLLPCAAVAQPVTVIGPVTPGNIPQFNSPTVIKDSGVPAASFVSGPVTSVIGDCATWNNLTGTSLSDTPCLQIYGTQAANTILAGPLTGSPAFPTWRAGVLNDISNWGTGVKAAVGTNIGSAGAPVLFNGALGTPSSGTIGTGIVLGPVTVMLSSDGTGDIYYRNSSGILTRLGIGSGTQVLGVSGGLPAWVAAPGTGTVTTLTAGTGIQFSSGATCTTTCTVSTTNTPVLLNTLTASSSATLSDTSSLTGTYSIYEIVLENIVPATNNSTLELQVHSGGTFPSTSYLAIGFQPNGTAIISVTPTTFLPLSNTNGVQNAAPGVSGAIRFYSPSTTTIHMITALVGVANGATGIPFTMSGYLNSSVVVDGFQILFSAGNITSGVVKIYGYP